MTPRLHAAGIRPRQLRILQLIFAAAAAIAMLAFFNAARPDSTGTALGSVRLTDVSIAAPLPQTPPGVIGSGGLAADDGTDQAQLAQQQAQLQQQMNQAEQQ